MGLLLLRFALSIQFISMCVLRIRTADIPFLLCCLAATVAAAVYLPLSLLLCFLLPRNV